MNASRIALISLICILALDLSAGVVDIKTTGTNAATGVATVQGDVFTLQPDEYDEYSLYSGVWAHVYVPSGNDGINAGISERTADARDDTRNVAPVGSLNSYSLTNSYGDSTVIAKASKRGVLGSAEAFSEISALSVAYDGTFADDGEVYGVAQLIAYVSHSGTGTANASADGSPEYEALADNCVTQSTGSASGEVSLDGANNYGGAVTGAAFQMSHSYVDSWATEDDSAVTSESFEYLSLESGRNVLSAPSIIEGSVSGGASCGGPVFLPGTPGRYAYSESSSKGDLSGTASTYKLGDSVRPSTITAEPFCTYHGTRLDDQIGTGHTKITGPLISLFFGGSAPKASAYLLSQSRSNHDSSDEDDHGSYAETESFTGAGVTRTLDDASEAYGASYIGDGALSATAYTSSAAGRNPITMASADVGGISMGSGAHLVSRLTGDAPASAADLVIRSGMGADAFGGVEVTGNDEDKLVTMVGPSYSSGGTAADATGSYLTASRISATAMHVEDEDFDADSLLIADDIDEINIWSWISGADPVSHCESFKGLFPFVSTPAYTSDPSGVAGETKGPSVIGGVTATSRSIDTVFESCIDDI